MTENLRRKYGLPRHRKHWMRGQVTCVKCGSGLSYEYGSIMWNCQERDLCPGCAAEEAVDRIFADMEAGRAALAKQ